MSISPTSTSFDVGVGPTVPDTHGRSTPTEEPEMGENTHATESVALVRRYVNSYNDRTLREDAEAIFAPDLVVVNEAAGLEAEGIDAYLEHAFDGWLAAVPDARVELDDYEVREGGIDFTLLATGTFSGELETLDGTVPGTGESFEIEFHVEADVDGDRITSWVSEYDAADWQTQVGLAERRPT